MKVMMSSLADLVPSQFMVSARRINELLKSFDETELDPVPIKIIDGEKVITDGHHRLCVMDLLGYDEVPIVDEEDILSWEAYRINVKDCKTRGLHTAADLKYHQVNEKVFIREWSEYCDSVHEMVKGIIIRQATMDDAKSINEIYRKSCRPVFNGEELQDAFMAFKPEIVINGTSVGNEEKKRFLCDLFLKNMLPIGFISTSLTKSGRSSMRGEVLGVYILPEYWKQGIGQALVFAGVERLKNRGCNSIDLWVPSMNSGARKFYAKIRQQLIDEKMLINMIEKEVCYSIL